MRDMTTENLLDFFINNAKASNISGNISREYVKKVCYENGLSAEELIGTMCLVLLNYVQAVNIEKDKAETYMQRMQAVEKTLEQLEKSQHLSSYRVKNLTQQNGLPRAKKFNENKFKMCIDAGATREETMEALGISESTYYRLLRAYRAKQ